MRDAVPEPLPDVDDLLAQHAPGALPDVDDLLAQNAPRSAVPRFLSNNIPTGPDADAYMAQSPAGRVLSAFGQGVSDGWGTGQLGMGPNTEAALRKAGIFNDVQNGQMSLVKSINEGLMRPAAIALDALTRGGAAVLGGLFKGGQQAVVEQAAELGGPTFARGVGELTEAELVRLGSEVPIEPHLPTPAGAVHEMLQGKPLDLPTARDLGVIGETEGAWKGVEPAKPVDSFGYSASGLKSDQLQPISVEANKPQEAPPLDVHGVARQIAPDTFSEYDALAARKDELRQQIQAAQADLRAQAEAQAPHAAEIADLEERMQDTTPRLAKKYQARLDALMPERDAFLADGDQMAMLMRDTPEIAQMRQDLLAADYRMRDLAPDVTAAYGKAAEQFPPVEEQVAPEPTPAPEPVAEPVRAAAVELTPAPAEGQTLFRGVPEGADARSTTGTVGGGLFYSPNEAVAKAYAGSKGQVVSDQIQFRNLLTAANWMEAKEKLGLPRSATMDELLRSAAAAGHDGLTFTTRHGVEFVHFPENVTKPVNIVDDVTRKLVAAGRPADEAAAAAQVTNALWQTRAASFEGRKGTAEEMYAREAPDIRAGREVREREMAQKGRTLDQAEKVPSAAPRYSASDADGYLLNADGGTELGAIPSGIPGLEPGPIRVARGTHSDTGRSGRGIAHIEARHGAEIRAAGYRDAAHFVQDLAQNYDRIYRTESGTINLVRDIPGRSKARDALITSISRTDDGYQVITAARLRRGSAEKGTLLWDGERRSPISTDGEPLARGGQSDSVDGIAEGESQDKPSQGRVLEQGAQGKIRLTDDGRSVITLMKTADASTFIHETGHDWLERMMRDAVDPDATPQMRADAATVHQYLGTTPGEMIPTRAHEKFARSFERYLMEGRAPSQALAGVFAKFKAWLTGIYQTVARLRAPITDDIRDVFDRLLTTNPDARTAIVPETPKEAGELLAAPVSKPTPLFPKAPKEPQRLVALLRKLGGVRDDGGDVAAIIGGPKARPGLISSTGMKLDDAALQAWEHGYFPEHGENRPTINDLLNAIEEDVKGAPQYSGHDAKAVQDYYDALRHRADIEKLAHDHGIDTTGMTRQDFFEALSKKVSQNKFDAEMESIGAAHESEYPPFAEEARAWSDDHGGSSWPEEGWYGNGDEEGSDAIQPADAHAAEGPSLPDQGQSGGAAGPAQPGEAGGGQGGRGAGDAGRVGQEDGRGTEHSSAGGDQPGGSGVRQTNGGTGSEPPAGPNQQFGRSDDGLTDQAGNIRLDNLNQPDDVLQAIRDAAAQNDDFTAARRGVVTDGQVLDLADALGMTPEDLAKRQIGQAFNAEQVMAARKLLVESATKVRDAMARAADGTDADVLAYGEAKARHAMIQEQVSGITAEAGRALRAFRMMGGEGDLAAINALVQQTTGRTLFQLRQEAKLGRNLTTPGEVSKFVADTAQPTAWQKARNQILTYFINNLISGPITHAAYAVGNTVSALVKAGVTTPVSSVIDAARGAGVDRVYLGEAGAQLYGLARGMRDGFAPGVEAFKTGIPFMKGLDGKQGELALMGDSYRPQVLPGRLGRILETPSRGVSAIHTVFYSMNYEAELARRAYRQAAAEGLEGDAFNARVATLTQSPPPQMMNAAHDEALHMVLMGRPKYGSTQQKVADLVNSNIILKLAMPFVQIGTNIIGEGLVKHSPLAVFSEDARADLMGKNGPVARTTQIAKIGVGTGLMAGTMGLAAEGLITGGGPSDTKGMQAWLAAGNQPYSIRIGETWYPYRRLLGPFGLMIGAAADSYHAGHLLSEGEQTKAAAAMVFGLSEAVLNETWMTGASNLVEAVRHWDAGGQTYLDNLATGFVPMSSAVRQVAAQIDPYAREAHGLIDKVRNQVPWLSEQLLAQRDIFGAPMARHTMMGPTQVNNDPVVQRLEALQEAGQAVWPAKLERKVTGVRLTDQQYDDFERSAGMLVRMHLDALVNMPGFSMLPDAIQGERIRAAITTARESARTLIKMQNPNIIQQAVANKQALLTGAK